MVILDEAIQWLTGQAQHGDVRAKAVLSKLYGMEVMESELARMKAQLSASKTEYDQLNQANIALDDQIDTLLAQLRDVEVIAKQNEDLRAKNSAQQKELERFRSEINTRVDLEDELERTQSMSRLLSDKCAKLEKKVSDLEVELTASKALANAGSVPSFARERALEKRNTELAADLKHTRGALAQAQNDLAALAKPYNKPLKPHERRMLTNSLRTAQQERSTLRVQNHKMKDYLVRLYNYVDSAKTMDEFFTRQELQRLDEALDIIA